MFRAKECLAFHVPTSANSITCPSPLGKLQTRGARRLSYPPRKKNKLQIKPNALWYLFFYLLKKKKRSCIETMVICPQRPFHFFVVVVVTVNAT